MNFFKKIPDFCQCISLMKVYWNGTCRNSSCLHRLLQEVLGCAPAIILMFFFCKVKNLPSFGIITPVDTKFYNRIKGCIVNSFVLMLPTETLDLIAKHVPLNLGIISSVWFFQFMWLSICNPRNFLFPLSSVYSSL